MDTAAFVKKYFADKTPITDYKEYRSGIERFMALKRTEVKKIFNKLQGVVKQYRYMVTFTLDPKKGYQDESKHHIVEAYIRKQFGRKPLKVVEAHIVKEGGDDDHKHTHWHVVVTTTKPLKKDRFNYYIKLYGNIDISVTKAQNIEEGLTYIAKSNTPEQIV